MKIRPSGIYVDGAHHNYTRLDSLGVPVSFIDIDMYGSEIDVLKGAAETIIMQRPELLITLHEDRIMKERERIIGLLSQIFDLPIEVKDESDKLHIWIRDGETAMSYFREYKFQYYRRGPEPIFYFDGWTTEVRLRDKLLRNNEIVYDIGAHIGGWTIPAALISKKVYSFEPNIDCANILRDNLELNGLKNVEIFNLALTNGRPMKITTCMERMNDKNNNSTQQMRLDDIDIDPPQFMKIDVEGAEVEVLKGAQQTINTYHPRIMVEPHNVNGMNTTDEIIRLLNGYNVEISYGDTLIFS